MERRNRWSRWIAMMLAAVMVFTSQPIVSMADIIGGVVGQKQTEVPDAGTESETDAAVTDEDAVLNTVTFVKTDGAVIKVGDEEIADKGTADAKNGTIVFTITPEKGYEITNVWVDGDIPARHTLDEDGNANEFEYIIEYIQTNETVVSVETQAVETEAEPESETATPAETEAKPESETVTPTEQTEESVQIAAPSGMEEPGVDDPSLDIPATLTPGIEESSTFETENGIALLSILGNDVVVVTINVYNANGTLMSSQLVKTGDIIRDVGTPSDENQTFIKWTATVKEKSVDVPAFGKEMTSEYIEAAELKDGDVIEVKPEMQKLAYVQFVNEDGGVVFTYGGIPDSEYEYNVTYEPADPNKQVTGWQKDGSGNIYDLSGRIKLPGESGVILIMKPVLTERYWITFDSQGGSLVQPEFYITGQSTKEPSKPTKTGYTFDGWYTEAESGTKYSFGGTLNEDVQLYAHWTPVANTTYTVVIWTQKISDTTKINQSWNDGERNSWDDDHSQHSYDFYKSYQETAATGTIISDNRLQNKNGNKNKSNVNFLSRDAVGLTTGFDKETCYHDTNVVVKADGSTLVNVYYDRIILCYTFEDEGDYHSSRWGGGYHDDRKVYGLYESTFAQNGYAWNSKYNWYDGKSNYTFLEGFSVTDDKYFYHEDSTGNNVYHYRQHLDGKYYTDDMEASKGNTDNWTFSNKFTGYTVDSYTNNFNDNGGTNKAIPNQKYTKGGSLHIYHRLNVYDLTYYTVDENKTTELYKKDTLKYTESFQGHVIDDPTKPANIPDYYSFAGWFYDPTGQASVNWEEDTMPANNVAVYAIWKNKNVTVSFNLNGGEGDTPTQQMIEAGTKARDPEAELTKEGFTFAGWTTEDGDIFSFETAVIEDTTLYAKWVSAAKSVKVVYDPSSGTNAPTDATRYTVGAPAYTLKGATPPENQNFVGWKLPDGSVVMPGNKFDIKDEFVVTNEDGEGTVTLTAVYMDINDETTNLTYHSNYPDGTDLAELTKVRNGLKVNHNYTPEGNPFTSPDGYEFVGWATFSGAATVIGDSIRVDNKPTNDLYAVWKPLSGKLTIKKTVEGSESTESFSVTVTASNLVAGELAKELLGMRRWENGTDGVMTYTFNLHNGETQFFEYLPLGTYTVTENGALQYTKRYSPTNGTVEISTKNQEYTVDITNTLPTVDVSVTKKWVTDKNEIPKSITVELLANREVANSYTLTGEGKEWLYTFKNMPELDEKGKKINYTVREVNVPHYKTEITGGIETGYTITNISQEKTEVTGTKTWVDGGKEHNNAGDVKLTLSRTSANPNGGSEAEPVEGATATWEGNKYTFSGLDKYDAKGYEYTYSVAEAAVEGYTTTPDGNNFTNTINTINDKTEVTGTKTWVDGGKEHNNAEELTLTLSRTSAKGGSTAETVETTATWSGNTYTFSGLDKYDAEGYEYTYSVAEAAVEGYTTDQDGNNFTNTVNTINDKIDVSGTKTWVDGGKEHNNADEVTLTLSRTSAKEGSEAETVEGATATWVGNTYTFKDMAKYDAEGYEYTYSVAEGTVNGYTTKQTGNNFTNTVNTINDKIDVTGKKTWVDGGKTHDNAKELTLTLSRTSAKAGSGAETVEATATWEGDTYTFAGVAKYDAEGYAYTYSVTEAAVDGYTTTSDGNNFTNTVNTINDTMDVTGTKTWVDGGKTHDNAKELTLTLSRTSKNPNGGSTAETVAGATVTWEGNTYTFADQPKYDKEGYEYTYSVAEAAVEGYTTEQAGNNFTNTVNTINDKIDVSGTKTWVDGGKEHNNAEELTLTLSRTSAKAGSEAEPVEATATWDGNAYTFAGLAKYDAEGYKYTYSVAEAEVEGYTTEQTGNNFTNTMDGIDAKIDVTGTKTWVDGGKEHNNAEELTLTLSRKSAKAGSEAETVEATATWEGNKYTFSGLAKYDAEGYEYTYTVSEAEVDGYTTTSDGNDFTNTVNTINDKIDVTGTKTWVDGGREHNNAEELTLTLSRTSAKEGSEAEPVEGVTATWEGNTYTFKDVAKYDAEGYEYTYSVAEAAVDGYTTGQTGNDFTNTINTINDKIDVTGTKTWVDGGQEHDNAKELTLTLSRKSAKEGSEAEPVEGVTATWDGNKYTFKDVAKYDAEGYVYTYSVAEAAVTGYTTTSDSNNFTNTVNTINDTTDVTGTKTWVDGGRPHDNAEELKLTLSRTSAKAGSKAEPVEGATATWDGDTYTFAGVAKYDKDGYEYTYSVAEVPVEGYTTEQAGNDFTNTVDTINTKIDVTGTKTWVDGGQTHNNAEELTLTLSRKSAKANSKEETVTVVTATWDGDKYTFADQPKYDKEGYEYTYSVSEAEVEGYTTDQDGNNFTNTVNTINDKIDVTGTKTWVDGGMTHDNAEDVTLTLSRTSTKAGSTEETVKDATLTWNGDTYTFKDVAKYDAEGYEYTYSVAEAAVEGYTTKQTNNDFTNTASTINDKIDITGTKTWVDGGQEHNNADEVTLTLSCTSAKEGSEAEPVEATATWSGNTYTFKDVAKYDAEGYEYTYSVSEAAVTGYTTKQDGNDFTNTINTINDKIDVSGTKTWVDGGKEHNNAEELTLTLSRTSAKAGSRPEPVDDATATWDGNKYTFKDVPKYDAEGYAYTYSVAETAVKGYSRKQEDNNFTNTMDGIDAKIDVTGTKTWVDGGKEHNNAEELTLTLSRTSAKAGSTAETVNATATWDGNTYTFKDVAKYDAEGYEYTYSVAEAAVTGYITKQTGNDFTNTVNTINDKIDIMGTKTWVDGGKKHNNAEDVTLTLSRTSAKEGSEAETVEATATWDGNTYTFKDVAKYDAEGYEYTYSVAEAEVEDYTTEQDGYNFTNKMDNDDPDNSKTRGEVAADFKVTVELADGTVRELLKVGAEVTYTINYYNHTNEAADVTITDTLPAGTEFVSASEPGENNNGTVTWMISNVEPFARGSVTVTVKILENASADPIVENKANIHIGSEPVIEVSSGRDHVAKPALTTEKVLTNKGTGENGKFKAGETAEFDITVTNSGNTTQTNVTVTEKLAGATIVEGEDYTLKDGQAVIAEMKPGAVVVVKATYTVTQADIDSSAELKNIATVDGENPGPDPEEKIPEEDQKKSLIASKTVTNRGTGVNGTFKAGETAEFAITVTNTGNTTQKNVTVTEKLAGATIVEGEGYTLKDGQAVIAEMAPDAVVVVKATYTVTQADIDKAGNTMNIASIGGGDPTDPVPKVEREIPEEGQNPGLSAVKTVTNAPEGGFKAGETAEFAITVTNTGNTTQKNVTVTEELAGATIVEDTGYTVEDGTATIGEIPVGGSVMVKARYTVTQADIDSDEELKNIVAVNDDDPKTPELKPEVQIPEEPKNPSLVAEKSVTNAGTGEGGRFKANETAKFDIVVENTGNTTQKDVVVTEKLAGAKIVEGTGYTINEAGQAVIGSMKPGAKVTVKAEYTVKQADIDSDAELKNIALVKGDNGPNPDPDPEIPVPEDEKKPGLTAAKSVTNAPKDGFKAGQTAEFTITVTNSGNTTQKNVIVTEQLTGAKIVEGTGYTINAAGQAVIAEMAPNATVAVKAQYKVTQKDIDSDAKLKNIALVDGDNGDEPDPTPEVDIPEEPKDPGLTAAKSVTNAPKDGFKAGQTAKFAITVTNSGNTTQTNVTVTEKLAGATIVAGEGYTINEAGQAVIAEMAPDATVVVEAQYTVTQEDIDSDAKLKNIALVDGDNGDEPDPTPEADIPEEPKNPGLTAAKSVTNTGTGEGGKFKKGDAATFAITVTNSGNTTQTDVTVTEKLAGATIVAGEGYTVNEAGQAVIAEMAPGATVTVNAAYTVTQEDIDNSDKLKNIAAVDGDNGPDPDPTPEIPVPEEDQKKSLSAVKTVTNRGTGVNGTFKAGETANFDITVTNTGNTTQKNVTVTEKLEGAAIVAGTGYTVNADGQAVIAEMAPGAEVVVKAVYQVTQADIDAAGNSKNIAAIGGGDPTEPVPDPEVDIPEESQNPDLSAVKTVTNRGTGAGGTFKAGETAEFDITVTNTGNTTQKDVTVTEQLAGAAIVAGTGYTVNTDGTATIGEIPVGGSVTVKAEYTVTQADIDDGAALKNIAAVDDNDPEKDNPEPEVQIPEEPRDPSLTALKSLTNAGTGEDGTFKAGETAAFDITVTNSGNTTQTNVTVTEKLAGAEIVEGEGYTVNEDGQAVIAEMKPGAVVVVKAEYTVTQADIDSDAELKNIALVEGDNGTNPDPEPEIPVPEDEKKPGLTAVKTLTNEGTGTDADGNSAFKAGETAEFDIVVENTGNTTQTDVTVTEKLAGAVIVAGDGYTVNEDGTATIGEIPVGGSVTVKAEYTVTQADIDSDAQLKNIALVEGDNDTEPDPDPETEIPEEEKKPGLTAVKTLTNEGTGTDAEGTPNGTFKAGDTAEFDITVTNSGNTTQTDVTVTEQLAGAKIAAGEGYTVNEAGQAVIESMAPGAVVVVKAAYTVTQADIDSDAQLKNIALVEGDNGTKPDPDPETEIPEEEKKPGLTAAKSVTNKGTGTDANGVSNGTFKAGETAEFDITVTNSGNTTQENVIVTEQLAGAEIVAGEGYTITDGQAVIAEMAPGAVVVVKAAYTVTQADIDNNAELKNIALVEGDNGTEPDPDPETEIPEEPQKGHLTVTKTTTSTPENGMAYALGEVIRYSVTVTNDGNLTVTDIAVTDKLTGNTGENAWTIESLEPGVSETFTAEYTVTEADILAGHVMNEATVKGTSPDPDEPEVPAEPGEDDEPTTPKNGHLTVTKTTTSTPAPKEDGTPNTAYALGETITYEITAANDGNLTLTDVVVTDELTGDEWTAGTLEPGESRTYTAEYTVTEADVLAGHVMNEATAKGTSPDPDEPEVPTEPGEDDEPVQTPNPSLFVEKTANKTSGAALGETVTYTITVTNNGNVTVSSITVSDPLTGDTWTEMPQAEGGAIVLEPGDSVSFTAAYTVTEEDIVRGSVANTATAEGTDPDNNPVDGEGGETVATEEENAHLTITKTTTSEPANGETYALGETITYSITAANDGNVTLTDVVVTDELTGNAGENAWTIESLAPGASQTFNAEYVVTEADILAGSVKNVAAAAADNPNDPDDPDDPDKPEVPVDPGETDDPTDPKDAHLTVTKTATSEPANGETYALGETVTYEITATNDGNITLTDVVVTDELTGNAGENAWTVESLAPGESQTFTAEYVVTEADILAGSVKNVAAATATDPTDPTDPDDPDKPEVPVDPGETEVPTEPENAHLTVTKATTSTPANGETYALGETITYSITATNDGNVTLTDVAVTDELTGNAGENAWTIESLAPGASQTFTAEYVVTEADILAGSVKNVATATADNPNDPDDPDDPDKPEVPVEPGDTEDPTEPKAGHVTVAKTVTSTPANGETYALGETITYSITATNDGNLTLTDITVTDELTGDEWTVESLAPGQTSEAFTASYVVTEADIRAGSVVNVATAEGTSPDPEEPDVPAEPGETEVPTEPANGHITVAKTVTSTPASGTVYAVGETVSYQITATNDGNRTVADVTVTDALTGDEWTIESLAPGASRTFTAQYTVTVADAAAGSVVNVATAAGTVPNPDDPENPDVPEVPSDPGQAEVPVDPGTGSITVTKANRDFMNGDTIALPNAQFRVALFSDAALTRQAGAAQTITFGADGAAASATFSGLSIGTYYVAEVDESGAVISLGTYDGAEFIPTYTDGQQAVVGTAGAAVQFGFVNSFLSVPDGAYYRNATLTITKEVKDSAGKSVDSDETFYAGIFADAGHTVPAENVSSSVVALAMNGGSSASQSVEVTVPADTDALLYVAEVDKNGVPVEGSASFGYDVTVENSDVTLADGGTAETVITNTVKEKPDRTGDEITDDDKNSQETVTGSGAHDGAAVSANAGSVKTGDETPIVLYLILLLGAALLLILGIGLKRRLNKKA